MVNKKVLKVVTALFLSTVLCASCGKVPENVDNEPESEENTHIESEVSEEKDEEAAVLGRRRVVVPDNPVEVAGLDNGIRPYSILVANNGLVFTDTHFKSVWKYAGDKVESIAGGSGTRNIYDVPESDYNDGEADKALFGKLTAIEKFLDWYIVADSDNDALRLIHNGDVETVNAVFEGSEKLATFDNPTGLATDKVGNLYVSDTNNGRIIRITTKGLATVILKNLKSPMGLSISGNTLYIAETGANRILKTDLVSDTLKTEVVAGNGEEGFEDGDVKKALFSSPKGILVSGDDIYVADTVNGAVRLIRDGEVTTIIKGTDGTLDGYPISPTGLCILDEKMYVCDNFNGKIYVFDLK